VWLTEAYFEQQLIDGRYVDCLGCAICIAKKASTIASKIKLNLMVNSSYMFQFWGLEYASNANGEIILRTGSWNEAKKKLFQDDYNDRLVTRVFLTRKIFGLNNIKNVFLKVLKDNQGF
jgi:hypothetical protein